MYDILLKSCFFLLNTCFFFVEIDRRLFLLLREIFFCDLLFDVCWNSDITVLHFFKV